MFHPLGKHCPAECGTPRGSRYMIRAGISGSKPHGSLAGEFRCRSINSPCINSHHRGQQLAGYRSEKADSNSIHPLVCCKKVGSGAPQTFLSDQERWLVRKKSQSIMRESTHKRLTGSVLLQRCQPIINWYGKITRLRSALNLLYMIRRLHVLRHSASRAESSTTPGLRFVIAA